MGEFSKRIGDVGEDIVIDFLALIGWNNPVRNFDIPSIDPEKHEKDSHGIDGYFHYKSPTISKTLENILVSVKYNGYAIEIEFENSIFNFGNKIKGESKTTQNFSQAENWVVLECVDRLLEKKVIRLKILF